MKTPAPDHQPPEHPTLKNIEWRRYFGFLKWVSLLGLWSQLQNRQKQAILILLACATCGILASGLCLFHLLPVWIEYGAFAGVILIFFIQRNNLTP